MNLRNCSFKVVKVCLFFSLLIGTFSSCTIETDGTSSNSSSSFSQLKTPVVTFSNNELVWADVKNALLYEVLQDGVYIKFAASPHVIKSESQNGEYTVRSIPNHKLNRYLASEATEPITVVYETPVKIAAPTLSFNDNVLSWDEKSEAKEYIVYKNDGEVARVATNRYVLKAASHSGEYKVSIVVKSTARVWLDSDLSTGLAVTFAELIPLDTPNLSYSTNTLSWDSVADANSYGIFIEGTVEAIATVTEGLTYPIINDTYNGEYHVVAYPLETTTTLKQSSSSNAVTVVYK